MKCGDTLSSRSVQVRYLIKEKPFIKLYCFLRLPNEHHKPGGFETREPYYLTFLDAKTPNSRCQQVHALPENCRGILSCFLQLLMLCWQPLAFCGVRLNNVSLPLSSRRFLRYASPTWLCYSETSPGVGPGPTLL